MLTQQQRLQGNHSGAARQRSAMLGRSMQAATQQGGRRVILQQRGCRIIVEARSGRGCPSLLTLPVFPLGGVAHPLDSGVLRVFEPRYLALFRDLLAASSFPLTPTSSSLPEPKAASASSSSSPSQQQQQQQQQQRDAPMFVHALSGAAAPRALLDASSGAFGGSVGGLPRIACAAAVRDAQERADGTLVVRYDVLRRVQLINIKSYGVGQTKYNTCLAEWFDDLPPAEPDLAGELEVRLYGALRQLTRLTAALGEAGSLPAAVHRYAPPDPRIGGGRGGADGGGQGESLESLLHRQGKGAAAHQISTWRRASGVEAVGSKPALDPYDQMREELGKEERQELFSFAAAALLEADVPTRVALLMSRDTAARMAFVLRAIEPYAKQLQAQAAVQKALQPPA